MCSCDDFERPAVFEQVTRRANKLHRCGECMGIIAPGCRYYESRGLWDGQWSTHKTCGSCYVVAHTLLDCYSFGELMECLDWGIDLTQSGSSARVALAGMMRRRRRAERMLRQGVAA